MKSIDMTPMVMTAERKKLAETIQQNIKEKGLEALSADEVCLARLLMAMDNVVFDYGK
mgnify:CR=1 FL=1